MKKIPEEYKKWAIGALIAAVVFVAAVYFVLNPLVVRLVNQVGALQDTVAEQKVLLEQQKVAIAELDKSRTQVQAQLDNWKKQVGDLIDDPKLTADLKASLIALKDLPPDKRNFVELMNQEESAVRDVSDLEKWRISANNNFSKLAQLDGGVYTPTARTTAVASDASNAYVKYNMIDDWPATMVAESDSDTYSIPYNRLPEALRLNAKWIASRQQWRTAHHLVDDSHS
jgi:hypothetical protein